MVEQVEITHVIRTPKGVNTDFLCGTKNPMLLTKKQLIQLMKTTTVPVDGDNKLYRFFTRVPGTNEISYCELVDGKYDEYVRSPRNDEEGDNLDFLPLVTFS